jgi:predicted transcriptional regulator
MFRSPTAAKLPPFSMLYDDMPASLAQIARHLGLTPATVQKYLREDQAPRAVMLALFWESRWGRSTADCEAANFGQVHYAHAQCLKEKVQVLQEQIGLLEAQLGQQDGGGAANGPIWRIGLKPLNF